MKHHWTGWPGAVCFHCGSEDPWENALGLNWFDLINGQFIWDTEEHRLQVEKADQCHIGWGPACPQCAPKDSPLQSK